MNERFDPLTRHPRVRDFRNAGMIWAFEIDSDDPQIGRRVYLAALEREMLLRPIGATVYFMPPYVISDDEQEMLADRTISILDSVA
jgi:adenosylmethionine-8-amino-7-oxononanoate aminotransferase